MNRAQKQANEAQLRAEQKTLRELKQVYAQARKDCEAKIAALNARKAFEPENLQTIIYQEQYQRAIQRQIDSALQDLDSKQYETVSDFIRDSYVNGYTGVMYDLNRQGIPLTVPIDQEQVAQAVRIDSKISQGLYSRLGEDVRKLKNSIRAEVSRGIANGSSWIDVAEKIAKGMNSPFNRAMNNAVRIARTEGHRVQQSAALDAQQAAKKAGADVVKQWDSTLDNLTRPAHQEADGQIREVDEPFDVGGEQIMAPGEGSAENCINCRCVLLQRAKWALSEAELDVLKARAEFYGLDKTDQFEEFKEKYLQATESEAETAENIVRTDVSQMTANEADSTGREIVYEHWEEYRQKFLGYASPVDFDNLDSFMYDKVHLGTYGDKETVSGILTAVDNLSTDFYSPLQGLRWMDKTESLFSNAFATTTHQWGYGSAEIRFNPVKMTKEGLERVAELSAKGYAVNIPAGRELEYLVTHEFGHSILNIGEDLPSKSNNFVQCDLSTVRAARKEIEGLWNAYTNDVGEAAKAYEDMRKALDSKAIFDLTPPTEEERQALNSLKEAMEEKRISAYSMNNMDEFVAEAFADARMNETPSEYSKQVYGVLTKYFGKGGD